VCLPNRTLAPPCGTSLRVRCDSAIFVGDDDTDEDAFAVADGFLMVGIRVGRSTRSRAEYFLTRQADIDQLLATLVRLR